jgi:hypothetical protein
MRRSRSRRRRTPRRIGLALLAFALVGLGFVLAGLVSRSAKPARARPTAPRPSLPSPRREPERRPPAPSAPAPSGRIALVIDDLGRSLEELDRVEALGVPVSYAVLPFERRTAEVVARLHAERREVLCHLPMEATGGENPGANAIRETQSAAEITALTRRALDGVPGAVGVNNHMGSRVTADPAAMRAILGVVAERGLFFVDSRTTPESRAYELAQELDIPSAQREIFLDAERTETAVRSEFVRLLDAARAKGAAIGIAHPHPVTLAVLGPAIAAARRDGFEFVPVSYLVDRNEKLPD